MKKFFAIIAVLLLIQNWSYIGGVFAGTPDYANADGQVVLYATQWCGYCQKTRELFAKHGIAYVEFDIEKSPEGHRAYKKLGGRGVPVISAYGTVIHGYSEQRILAAARPR